MIRILIIFINVDLHTEIHYGLSTFYEILLELFSDRILVNHLCITNLPI